LEDEEKMIRLQRSRWIGWLPIALLALSMSPNLYAQHQKEPGAPTKSTLAKIAQLLDQSGYTYTKAGANVWTVKFKGKALSDFNVLIAGNESLLVVSVDVAEKKNLKGNSPEMMYKLLKFNFVADFVKIGLDDDDDLFVRADLTTRTLDLQELKDVVDQVAVAADQVYTTVRPFMTAP
jgi:hypothetical protein